MKIDVGPQARLVGTKRVSADGQVNGLSEFAGRDVLIVVPTRAPKFELSSDDLLHQLRVGLRRRGTHAVGQFRTFRRRHLRTSVPGSKKLLRVAPAPARPMIRRADAWVRREAQRWEKRAEQLLAN